MKLRTESRSCHYRRKEMVSLLEGGAYLLRGTEIIPDSPEAAAQIKAKTGKEISKEQAKKETIAYGILEITIRQEIWIS